LEEEEVALAVRIATIDALDQLGEAATAISHSHLELGKRPLFIFVARLFARGETLVDELGGDLEVFSGPG